MQTPRLVHFIFFEASTKAAVNTVTAPDTTDSKVLLERRSRPVPLAESRTLRRSVQHAAIVDGLRHVAAHPDGLVSLHNFMACDPRYADKRGLGPAATWA
jgi:hypothetical protein